MEQTASTEETLAALAAGSNVLAAAGGFVPSGADALELASTENAAAGLNDRSLESTAVNATFWTVLDYGASTCLRVVSSLWLTRLLLPAAFGEAGLVMTLIIGVTLLSDVGLAPSVIQNRRGDEPAFLNTIWTIQAIRGVALWVIALLLAYPAAVFYHDPHLLRVLPALALITVLNGFNGTGLITLSKHMGVKRLFLLDFSTQLVLTALTIGFAMLLHNVWALVLGNLCSNVFRLVLSHTRRAVPRHPEPLPC